MFQLCIHGLLLGRRVLRILKILQDLIYIHTEILLIVVQITEAEDTGHLLSNKIQWLNHLWEMLKFAKGQRMKLKIITLTK